MLYAAIVFVFLLLILIMMPVVITFDLSKDGENRKIAVDLKTMYGLLRLKMKVPLLKIAYENGKLSLKYKIESAGDKKSKLLSAVEKFMNMNESEDPYKTLKENRHKISSFLNYIILKTKISNFNFKIKMGTYDAAITGALYGLAWIVIGSVMTLVKSRLNMGEPIITVIPVFGRTQLSVDFSCIISIKLGHIIYAGIKGMP